MTSIEQIIAEIKKMDYSELETLRIVIDDREARLDRYSDWEKEQREWDGESAADYEYPQF